MIALPVVVGIDGGPASVAALQVAMREAELRQTEVLAIICWPADARGDDSAPVRCDSHEAATAILEHVIGEATHHDANHVPIVREVSQSYAGPTLVAAARNAELLVVGSTDRGPGTRHSTHHTVEHCLRYSVSPVLVAPWTLAVLEERDIETDLPQASVAQ
jgi:nucleotide-binding universal stress UspA family protein